MINTQSVRFTTKLFVGILTILLLSIVVILGVVITDIRQGLFVLGKSSLECTLQSVYNSLETQNVILQKKLETDLFILEAEIEGIGQFHFNPYAQREQTITNQVTRQSEKVRIPSLMLGSTTINENTNIVDKVQGLVGGVATIFQVVDDKLLRVATNVRTTDNQRAVGTYIPSDSPVYQSVMRGETYTGRAFVVDDWYVTAYKPMRDEQNKIVAVLFVGSQILTPALHDMIASTKASNVGYFFIYDSTGTVLVHPTLEGQNIFEINGIGEFFRNHKQGFLEYFWENDHKVSFTKHFAPWDWHVAAGLNNQQMLQGLDQKIITKSALVSIFVLAAGIIISLILIRAIARPLNNLASESLKMADGDYTVSFVHPAQDAIGHLSSALNTVVGHTKTMLEEISGVTSALATSSTELTSIAAHMTDSSNQTASMANTVNNASQDVSTNMSSVSAAMEQASVNMTSVSVAAEEMSATIHEIAENAERAKNTTSGAVNKAQETSGRVDELGRAAQEISAVTETISAISSQTNLLALNATIEAARAGEAGRGFAVVANEIKELALQTSRATEDIRNKIGGVQSVTAQTVQEIFEITQVINEMNEIVGAIAAAVEEQSVTTRDIAENVSQASLGITEINTNVGTSSSMTQSISSDIEQVRRAAEEMSTSSLTVQQSSTELSTLAERLRQLVAHFKI
ncbi:MAG: HAMP domain-containing protein [Desulfovibrionales bacterium]|nr:HAMP domain-containing protein [Desulfovibrionales bacterium]